MQSEVLFNPTWEQIVERDPLIAFSFYLSGRKNVLLALATEIIENLDAAYDGDAVDGARLEHTESLMWFWILGAYEVVRTMCQAETCFSHGLGMELKALKKTLAAARMPAAKMEKMGSQIPVTSNRSPTGWDHSAKDLLVGDPDEPEMIRARPLLAEFVRVFSSIGVDDVLSNHEQSNARRQWRSTRAVCQK